MQARLAYRQALPPVWLLILVAGVGPLGMNITLPATTELMRDLGSSYGVAQLVLTLYLLSTAVSQLFLGSLSDVYGRRPVMLAGFVIFIVGSMICALASDTGTLLLGRVVQGLGGSVGISLSRVIVRDVFDREKSASVIGYITMAMVISPMLGPVIGGFLTQFASWRFIFWTTLILALVILVLVYFFQHETRKPHEPESVRPGLRSSALTLIKEPAFTGYALTIAFASGMFFLFLGGAPYIFTHLMNTPPSQMGLYFTLNAIGYAMGNFISGRFAVHVGTNRLMSAGLVCSALGLSLLWFFHGVMHPLAMSLPMLLITLSNGLVLPSATSGALSVRPSMSGAASGIAGALQIGMASMLTFIIGFVQNDGQVRLFLLMTACGLLSMLTFRLAKRHDSGS
ncbi:MAG: multidrug effflux MFS transporter [Gammaproteobacteria bacterium]|nr:multidrug effflux MFS transporter [Gammaproteobacteria bacterium]